MNRQLLGLAVCLIFSIGASDAFAVSFVGYGTALPAGETLITNFSNAADSDLSGNSLFETGSFSFSAAPAINGTTRDPNQYLSLQTGQSETITFPSYKDVSIYLGSLDSYNKITFSNGQSFTGDQLAALTGAVDDGDQSASTSNGRFIFDFTSPVDSVTLSSSGIAFEVASIAGGVPEPATWTLMMIGFGGIGAAMRRARRRQALAPA